MKLDYFLREEHFNALAILVLVFSFAWTYFFFNDYLVEWYGGEWVGHQLLALQAHGRLAPFWYAMLFFNIVIPWTTLWNKGAPFCVALFLVTIGINIAYRTFTYHPGLRSATSCSLGRLQSARPGSPSSRHQRCLSCSPSLQGDPLIPVWNCGRAVEP
jgi:hypothetical protein